MKKIHAILAAASLVALAILAVACTSSSTNVSTNRSYDKDYTTRTASRNTSGRADREGFPEEVYVPPITLSLLAMNTGEVLPGESYPIVAVVDNPENRDLRYRWSVEDGEFSKLPESMRSEVVSFESQLRSNKGAGIPPSGGAPATEGGAAPTETQAPPPGPSEEGAVPRPAGGATGAAPAEAPSPPLPARTESGKPPAVEKPAAGEPGASGEAAETPEETPDESAAEAPAKDDGAKPAGEDGGAKTAWISGRYAVLAEESATEEEAAPEDEWPEPVEKEAAEEEDGSAKKELPEQTEEQAELEAAADEASDTGEKVEAIAETAEGFKGFSPRSGEGRLVEVDAEIKDEEGADEETLTDEHLFSEPPLVTFETEQPYVLWTAPDGVGSYTIRCIVLDNKGNEVTPERSFPVTVTEPEPKVELVWNTTKKLYEDDYLVVELRAKNIPNYYKGLFTLSFDPTVLSFRVVEKGGFFPEDYRASIYYAQPPMNPGKATVAISADEVGLPKGDGVLARVIFKLKEDVQDPTTLEIKQVTDPEARYILNAEGANILPQTGDKPLFATEWIDPPPAPTQTRARREEPASDLPQTPAPPTAGSPRTGRSSSPPPPPERTESTYIPPSGGFNPGAAGATGAVGSAGATGAVGAVGGAPGDLPEVDPRVLALQQEMQMLLQDETMNEDDKRRRLDEIRDEIQRIQSEGA